MEHFPILSLTLMTNTNIVFLLTTFKLYHRRDIAYPYFSFFLFLFFSSFLFFFPLLLFLSLLPFFLLSWSYLTTLLLWMKLCLELISYS